MKNRGDMNARLGQAQRVALIVGGLGLALSILAWARNASVFYRSYLFSYLFWLEVALGCLPWLMLYHLTGGAWGVVLRRNLEAATRTISLLALFFIPVFFGLRQLFPWTTPGLSDDKILHKAIYLNVPFFVGRYVFYFIAWLGLAHFLNRWSDEQARTENKDPGHKDRLYRLSAGGLVLYSITVTWAAIDWIMTLEPLWYSTIFGMVYMVSQALSALAFVLIIFAWQCRSLELSRLVSAKCTIDAGNVLLASIMVWAYLSFMQYLVIWSGNLPDEVTWMAHRTQGSWKWVALFLAAFQFGAPFFVLLFRPIKRHVATLCMVAAGVLAVRVVDRFWYVMPAFEHPQVSTHWAELTTFLGIGGIWLAAYLGQLRRRDLFHITDPDWVVAFPERSGER